jgi:hypothetical protein
VHAHSADSTLSVQRTTFQPDKLPDSRCFFCCVKNNCL